MKLFHPRLRRRLGEKLREQPFFSRPWISFLVLNRNKAAIRQNLKFMILSLDRSGVPLLVDSAELQATEYRAAW